MTTLRRALTEATARIANVSPSPRLDAELLAAHALGCTREAMLLARLDDPVPATFAELVDRRFAHEPVAYITGSRAFWTIDLAVGPGVLVPRADSETLIEAAVDHFAARPPVRILDLGTGPGTLLLAALAEWPQASGLGIDASETALDYARRNAAVLGMADRAVLRPGDWTAGIDERFDLILANPPYIGTAETLPHEVAGHEPAAALFAGADGLDEYRRIVPDLPRLLAPGGIAAIEIGHEQGDAVLAMVRAAGLPARLVRDLGDRPRCIVAG
ncbi:protein-(glutamine-N5) methyltransferase, release factor-specific [Sphingomonas sp. Leaf67]|uniref:peptide chain release factor N(5)-glutamine methyltransferase n=1 Tax=Sphingomonas sp. Leaf67 TaxID=1736230 RepID=UPI0006F29EEE|nr:peptide chain release factor N(5)-glutamine methyltransferase [Sphingomonas sp. Leaf67]KQN80820.1 protein-(glutamine-N5) methyltransferase, release factor-specific [Sphingomonas sp. Leaf67]